ncbi:MAG: EpsG family protein [Synergistaceae bacterium]|nr:EpsG family protein [Synergistaceae bacterium]
MIDGYNFWYWNVGVLLVYRLLIKDRKKFLLAACIQFFLVLAVRSTEIGVDAWYQYPQVYAGASRMSFAELVQNWSLVRQIITPTSWGGESGFVTLNWIFGHLLGLPYRALIVFLAFLAAFTMYKYLERNSYSPLLGAVTMYICLLSGNAYLSAIRRSTAMNFILFAYMAMMDKNRLKAALLILFAMTMHRSAIIIFLFLPFIDTKITRDLCRKIIVIIFAAGLIAVPVASRMLPIVLGWFGKASYFYGASGWLNSGARLEVKAVAGIVALLAIYFFLDFRLLNTAENNMLCKIFLFVIIFSPIQRIVPLLGDIYMYFTPSCYLLVENLIVQRKEDVFIKRMMQLTSLIVMAAVFSTRVEPLRNSYPQPTSGHYRTIWTSSSGR